MKLTSGVMIGNSNCIGTNLIRWILNLPPKRYKPYSVSSETFYIDKNDRTAHWVGHYKLKELNINDLFNIKHMNEDMEAELTEMDSKTEILAVSEDANVDEAIPIDIRK